MNDYQQRILDEHDKFSQDDEVLTLKDELSLYDRNKRIINFALSKANTFEEAYMIAGIVGQEGVEDVQESIKKIGLNIKIPSDIKQRAKEKTIDPKLI